MKDNIVGVREFRENLQIYVDEINRGKSFVVLRKSKPLFKITPYDEEDGLWEEVIDFTKIKKGGVAINDLLSRL
jgi:antitoxin (DNA-binding transcriptional repressor) of toxin-antitoxin stability system